MSELTDLLKNKRRETVDWMSALLPAGKQLDPLDAHHFKMLDEVQQQQAQNIDKARRLEMLNLKSQL